MNVVSSVGYGNNWDVSRPGHYPLSNVSPRPARRHTIVDHNIQPGFLNNLDCGSVRSGISDIHLSDFSKRIFGHTRNSSYASCKSSFEMNNVNNNIANNNNNNNNSIHRRSGIEDDGDEHAQRPLLTSKYLHTDDENDRASSYGMSLLEDLPLHHQCSSEGCERIIINVSGLKFETQLRTLNRLPKTLLGNPEKRKRFWNEERQEFFFDRHRPSFQAILYYYQSGGRLKKPLEVPMDIFVNELYFYEIGKDTINNFKQNEGYIMDNNSLPEPEIKWKRKIFDVLEYPESSWAAKIFALFSVIFILTSVVTFCVETLPQFRGSGCQNISILDSHGNSTEISVVKWHDPLFVVESCCIIFFVVELGLRFLVSPSKCSFLKMSINWIDLISIAPYFVLLGVTLSSGKCGGSHKGSMLSVLRVLRVVRILKLSKHSQGLKILGKTLKTSIRELSMFILFLGIATIIYAGGIYYVEMGQENSMFTSIPDAFWWAIVTMTTVGYGDYVPVGMLGKMLGGFCVLSGVLAIALPVPVIVANFNNYYRHYTGRRGKAEPPDEIRPYG